MVRYHGAFSLMIDGICSLLFLNLLKRTLLTTDWRHNSSFSSQGYQGCSYNGNCIHMETRLRRNVLAVFT